jgi:hypothetical protein
VKNKKNKIIEVQYEFIMRHNDKDMMYEAFFFVTKNEPMVSIKSGKNAAISSHWLFV